MDRASGSGVFARDPDAMLDLIELETTEALMKQEENKAICQACCSYLDAHFGWQDELSQDDMLSSTQMLAYCREKLDKSHMARLEEQIAAQKQRVKTMTAWRVEGILREFPKFEPVNLWFDYPIHRVDETGSLKDIQPESEQPPYKRGAANNKRNAVNRKTERKRSVEAAMENSNFGDKPTVNDVADYLGISVRSARDRIKEHGGYMIEDGIVKKKDKKSVAGNTES